MVPNYLVFQVNKAYSSILVISAKTELIPEISSFVSNLGKEDMLMLAMFLLSSTFVGWNRFIIEEIVRKKKNSELSSLYLCQYKISTCKI
jgi:hypothetical protein